MLVNFEYTGYLVLEIQHETHQLNVSNIISLFLIIVVSRPTLERQLSKYNHRYRRIIVVLCYTVVLEFREEMHASYLVLKVISQEGDACTQRLKYPLDEDCLINYLMQRNAKMYSSCHRKQLI